jgi:hypothetical protein
MKKIDALLKKVELFERIAVYGDRKSFLEALAQNFESFPPPSGQGINAPYVPGTAPVPPPPPPASTKPEAPVATPESAPAQAPAKPAPAGLSINPQELLSVQSYLNKDMLKEWPPVTPDGKWGPETARMVAQWAKKNKLNLGMQQLLDLAKSKAMGAGVMDQIQTGPNFEAAL